MSLLAVQRDIVALLRTGTDDAIARIGHDHAAGLRVYQNNYRAQLVACLEDSFAHTRDWIGGDAFHDAVVTHIDRVPPSSWTLDAYPRDFPVTLATLYPDDPEVAELAWMDAALGEAFVGPDHGTIGASEAAGVDWDHAVLHFTPTLDLTDMLTNAPAIWLALSVGEIPPAVERLPEPGAILVWRHEQISRFRAIEAIELQAIVHMRAGMSFAQLCDALIDRHGEAGIERAGTLLGRWLADGLVADTLMSNRDG
jgi:hypothetical protein